MLLCHLAPDFKVLSHISYKVSIIKNTVPMTFRQWAHYSLGGGYQTCGHPTHEIALPQSYCTATESITAVQLRTAQQLKITCKPTSPHTLPFPSHSSSYCVPGVQGATHHPPHCLCPNHYGRSQHSMQRDELSLAFNVSHPVPCPRKSWRWACSNSCN